MVRFKARIYHNKVRLLNFRQPHWWLGAKSCARKWSLHEDKPRIYKNNRTVTLGFLLCSILNGWQPWVEKPRVVTICTLSCSTTHHKFPYRYLKSKLNIEKRMGWSSNIFSPDISLVIASSHGMDCNTEVQHHQNKITHVTKSKIHYPLRSINL